MPPQTPSPRDPAQPRGWRGQLGAFLLAGGSLPGGRPPGVRVPEPSPRGCSEPSRGRPREGREALAETAARTSSLATRSAAHPPRGARRAQWPCDPTWHSAGRRGGRPAHQVPAPAPHPLSAHAHLSHWAIRSLRRAPGSRSGRPPCRHASPGTFPRVPSRTGAPRGVRAPSGAWWRGARPPVPPGEPLSAPRPLSPPPPARPPAGNAPRPCARPGH